MAAILGDAGRGNVAAAAGHAGSCSPRAAAELLLRHRPEPRPGLGSPCSHRTVPSESPPSPRGHARVGRGAALQLWV